MCIEGSNPSGSANVLFQGVSQNLKIPQNIHVKQLVAPRLLFCGVPTKFSDRRKFGIYPRLLYCFTSFIKDFVKKIAKLNPPRS